MNSNLRIPILIQRVADLQDDADYFHQRVARRAHEIFLNRGEAPGRDLDDWLMAEEELVNPSDVIMGIEDSHVVATITVPDVEPTTLLAKITPHEVLLISGPDDSGRRVFQKARFPQEVDMSETQAEFFQDSVTVFAKIAEAHEGMQGSRQVA
jgi:hypothetical protein